MFDPIETEHRQFCQNSKIFTLFTLFADHRITSPLLLFAVIVALGGTAAIMHFKENNTQIVVGGKVLGQREQALALTGICIPLLWLASAGSVVFWLLGI